MNFLKKIPTFNLVLIGNGLELFDLYLYVHLASILHTHLFPQVDESYVKIFSLSGIYFIGPLAALMWGYLGDTKGRKKVLISSSIIASVVTTLIAFIPEYSWWADNHKYYPFVILMVLRILQSIAMAGEPQAAKLYSMESYMSKDKDYFLNDERKWSEEYLPMAVTKMTMGESAGGMLALGLAYISMNYLNFWEWSWRFPFILASISIIFVAYLRRNILDTYEFERSVRPTEVLTFGMHALNLQKSLKSNRCTVFCYIVLGMSYPVLFVFNYFFLSPLIVKAMGYPKDFLITYNFFIVLGHFILEYFATKIPIYFGWNKKITMFCYHIIAAICCLAFMSGIIDHQWSIGWYLAIQILMMVSITWNLIYGSVVKSFPVTQRFTTIATCGGASKILQFILFSCVFSLFLHMDDVRVYGCCCLVFIGGAMLSIYFFSPYEEKISQRIRFR